MATAKLRKTFRYPSVDSDEDETPQALDEEGKMNMDYTHWRKLLSMLWSRTRKAHPKITCRNRGAE